MSRCEDEVGEKRETCTDHAAAAAAAAAAAGRNELVGIVGFGFIWLHLYELTVINDWQYFYW